MSRILSLFLNLSLALASPAFSLRQTSVRDNAGLEEEVARSLQGTTAGLEEEQQSIRLRERLVEAFNAGISPPAEPLRNEHAVIHRQPPIEIRTLRNGAPALQPVRASYELELWSSKNVPYFMRLGPKFFVDSSRLAELSPELRTQLRENLTAVDDLPNSTVANVHRPRDDRFGAFTYPAAAMEMQNHWRDYLVIDTGAGDGSLSQVHEGIPVLIENNHEEAEKARRNFRANGWVEGEDYFVIEEDLRNEGRIRQALARIMQTLKDSGREPPAAAIVSQVGTWPGLYEINNQSSMALIPVVREATGLNVETFIGGGYFWDGTQRPVRYLEQDREAMKAYGLTADPSVAVYRVATLEPQYTVAWQAVRLPQQAGAEETLAKMESFRHRTHVVAKPLYSLFEAHGLPSDGIAIPAKGSPDRKKFEESVRGIDIMVTIRLAYELDSVGISLPGVSQLHQLFEEGDAIFLEASAILEQDDESVAITLAEENLHMATLQLDPDLTAILQILASSEHEVVMRLRKMVEEEYGSGLDPDYTASEVLPKLLIITSGSPRGDAVIAEIFPQELRGTVLQLAKENMPTPEEVVQLRAAAGRLSGQSGRQPYLDVIKELHRRSVSEREKRLQEAAERFRVEPQQPYFSIEPAGFLLREKGLALAPTLALLEVKGIFPDPRFAGIVETQAEKDQLLAAFAGLPQVRQRLEARLVVVADQPADTLKQKQEQAERQARNWLWPLKVEVIAEAPPEWAQQLELINRILATAGRQLPEDPEVQKAARALLRAA